MLYNIIINTACRYRIDIRQLPNTFPHGGQCGQCRAVAVVQRAVRLAAQTLQFVGVAQHSTRCFELLVFAGADARLIQLLHLKTEEIDARRLLALVELKGIEVSLEPSPLAERRCDNIASRNP